MAFNQFPSLSGIGFPVVRSPILSTARHESIGGRRTIMPKWSVPRYQWELNFAGDGFLRSAYFGSGAFADLETLTAFYLANISTSVPFAYADAEDSSTTLSQFGTGDGSTTKFQLVRWLAGMPEPVYAPGTVAIYANGVLVPGANYSISALGVVTFATAPASAAVLTWTGAFSWLCRFDEDSLDLSRYMAGLTEAKSVKFSSVKSP